MVLLSSGQEHKGGEREELLGQLSHQELILTFLGFIGGIVDKKSEHTQVSGSYIFKWRS